ncbi:hypothetical protein C8J56DRAFT_903602 [Mycena floridula]|nr:hypothetical protein C8J56DRAFT_903602 [Mycena floridula]
MIIFVVAFIFSLQQISSLFSCTIVSRLSSIHGAPWPRIHSGLRQALHCGKQEGKMKGAKVEPDVESEKAKLDIESDNSKAKETWSPLNDALVSQISDLTRLESVRVSPQRGTTSRPRGLEIVEHILILCVTLQLIPEQQGRLTF